MSAAAHGRSTSCQSIPCRPQAGDDAAAANVLPAAGAAMPLRTRSKDRPPVEAWSRRRARGPRGLKFPDAGPQQKNDGLKANGPPLGSKPHYNRTTNYQAYFPLASRRRGSVKRQPSPSPPRPTMVESTSALEPPPPSPPRPTTSLTWSQRRECSGRGLNERIMGSN